MTHDLSKLKKRSVSIAGHRTSVSVEHIFWEKLKEVAHARGISLNRLVSVIDENRSGNLSSAIRVFVVQNVDEID